MLCFIGLLCFPVSLIFSLGAGAAVAVSSAILVNLSMSPVLLYSFPEFFADDRWGGLNCIVVTVKRAWRYVNGESTTSSNDDDDDDDEIKIEQEKKNNLCRRIGRFAVRTPNNIFIIVTIICLAIPGIVYFSKMTTSISYVFYTDKSAESTVAFENLLTDFGAGSSAPFMLLVVPKDSYRVNNMVISKKYFQDMNNLTTQFAKITPDVSPIKSFTGPFRAQGIPLKLSEYDEGGCCIVKTNSTNPCTYKVSNPQCRELEHLWTTQIDTNNITNYVNVRIELDPFSLDAEDWIDNFREGLKHEIDQSVLNYRYDLYLSRGTVDLHDSRKLTFSLFPWLVVLVLCVAFGFVGGSFRTLIVPARAVITIMLTLSFVFGLLVLTYQYGIFSWTGLSQLDNMHSIFWLSPVIAYVSGFDRSSLYSRLDIHLTLLLVLAQIRRMCRSGIGLRCLFAGTYS